MMQFIKATEEQTDDVFAVYSEAIIAMEKDGIHQWDEVYPDRQIIAEDIAADRMFVGIEDGRIAVCFVLCEECDDEYKNGRWLYPDSRFNVIHRLCVAPSFQHQGVAARTLCHIEKFCKSNGYDSIRLDCFTQNPYSRKLYDKAGYAVTGYADWRKGRFELREKKI